jgi:carboxyl-terminal processing protease
MEANSINRNEIDWQDFRSRVLAEGATSSGSGISSSALRLALELLGDNHSFILQPSGTVIFFSRLSCQAPRPTPVVIPENVGYVRVPGFSDLDGTGSLPFAEAIQDSIRRQDRPDLRGWIIDLRGNTGGNMWPMLAGVGPILGNGIAGYFISPDSTEQVWGYAAGASEIDNFPLVELAEPYNLMNPQPRVAVLLDQVVASSGEAIAIAFRGRENTRSFGQATCGQSTANRGFNLSNGGNLFLTVSYMADRNRNRFGVPVEPDVLTDSGEATVEAAVEFLME